MYDLVLTLHSWIRWIALIAGFAATFTAMFSKPAPGAKDPSTTWGLVLMASLDLQMLLGLLLYFVLSPNTKEILNNFGGAMADPSSRFWAVEHVTTMLAALVVAHVGRVLTRKATSPGSRRMRAMTCYALATILMIIGMPWPGRYGGRPLFRV